MPTPTLFASAELVVMGILANVGAPVVQSTSISLTPPLVRVRRVPGVPSDHLSDFAHVELMVYGDTFAHAQDLAERCRAAIFYAYATSVPLVGATQPSITVDATSVVLPPTEVPWPNPDVRVFQAVYQIVTRALR